MRDKEMPDARLQKSDVRDKDARCEIINARCEIAYCEIPGFAQRSRNLTRDTATTTLNTHVINSLTK